MIKLETNSKNNITITIISEITYVPPLSTCHILYQEYKLIQFAFH